MSALMLGIGIALLGVVKVLCVSILAALLGVVMFGVPVALGYLWIAYSCKCVICYDQVEGSAL